MFLLSIIKDHTGRHGWFGGDCGLSSPDAVPKDRQGKPMTFFLRLHVGETGWLSQKTEDGDLLLFVNNNLDFENPKDRFSFAVVFTSEKAAVGLLECPVFTHLSAFELRPFEMENAELPVHYLGSFYDPLLLQRAKEIAAFSSNGVGFSEARRRDSCYSHLVEAAGSWELLAKFGHDTDIGLNIGARDLLLLCHKDDLTSGATLGRARLVAVESGSGSRG